MDSLPPEPGEETLANADTGDALFMDYYRKGLTALRAEDWDRAAHLLRLALNIRPDSTEVLRHLRTAQAAQEQSRGEDPSGPSPGL